MPEVAQSTKLVVSEADRKIAEDALHRYFQSVWAAGGAGRAVIEQAIGRPLNQSAVEAPVPAATVSGKP